MTSRRGLAVALAVVLGSVACGDRRGPSPAPSASAPAIASAPRTAGAPDDEPTEGGPLSSASPSASPATALPSSSAPTTPPFEGTAGIEEKKRDGMKPAILRDVRVAAHEGYERVVFEWAGDAVPGWHVEYVDRPVRRCGSGDPTAIAGDGWLEVRMTPAQAHDDRGRATAGARERHPGQPIIREIESTCDFEGDVTWVIGVASPNRYRVLELASPARLVVDIRTDRKRR